MAHSPKKMTQIPLAPTMITILGILRKYQPRIIFRFSEKSEFDFNILCFALLILTISLLSPKIEAREWYASPSMQLQSVYNDNRRLRSIDPNSSLGSLLDLRASLGTRSVVSGIETNLRANIDRYISQDNLDSNDYFATINSFYHGELGQFTLGTSYSDVSTLSSELVDTGRVDVRRRRESIDISPRWSMTLGEKTSVQIGYSHSEANFPKAENTGLFDYTADSANITFNYHFNSKFQFFTVVNALNFDSTDSSLKTDNYGFSLGVSRLFSESWTGSLNVGGRQTKTRFSLGRSKVYSSGITSSTNLSYQYNTGSIQAGFSRNIQPSGSGNAVETDKMSFSWSQQLSEKLDFSLSTSFRRNTAVNTQMGDGDDDRIFFNAIPQLTWRYNQTMSFVCGYRYRRQKLENSPSVDSNSVFASINYRWEPVSISK